MYFELKPFTAVPFDVAFENIWRYERSLSQMQQRGAQYLGTSRLDVQYAFTCDEFYIHQQRYTSLELMLIQERAHTLGLHFSNIPQLLSYESPLLNIH